MNEPAEFRKKPITVKAIKYTGTNGSDVLRFIGPKNAYEDGWKVHFKNTLHNSDLFVISGDWVIKGTVEGDFYPCEAEVFDQTYEPVS